MRTFGCVYLQPKFDVNKSQDNPSVGYRRQLPLHSGAKADVKIENIYLQPKFDVNRLFMCKPAVCIGVQ